MNTHVKSEPIDDPDHDDNDPLVREINVFVSPALAHYMYLVQFPLQHHPAPLPEDARIRPNHGILELDQAIPNNIGREGGYFLPKRTLVSQTIPISTHMAIGKLHENDMYLVPLHHITQVRPTFAHVDEDTVNPSEPSEGVDEPPSAAEKKPLMFLKKETDRTNTARKSSYEYKKQNEESEDWVVLIPKGPGTDEHKNAMAQVTEKLTNSLTCGNSVDFVQSLNYLPKGESMDATTMGHDEDDQSLHLRVIAMLQRGWPVPYAVIRPQFPEVDDVDLLHSLTNCAVLVRGNFCLQSRFFGYEHEVAHARTFILYLCQIQGCVSEDKLNHVFSDTFVTPGWIRRILLQISIRTKTGWNFKLEDNHSFCELFPEQSKLHCQYWDRQEKRFQHQVVKYFEVKDA